MAMQKECQKWAKVKSSWQTERERGKTLIEYDARGNHIRSTSSLMRIEYRNGFNYFFTFHEQGTWTSINQVKADTWYEQMPWFFNGQVKDGQPDNFLVYRRIK